MPRPRKWGMFQVENDMGTAFQSTQSEIEELKSEMEDWYDSLQSGNFATSEKAERVEETMDQLNEVEYALTDISELFAELFPFFPKIQFEEERRAVMPRHIRLSNAIKAFSEIVTTTKLQNNVWAEAEEQDDIEEGIDELENVISELESVEFPNMFG